MRDRAGVGVLAGVWLLGCSPSVRVAGDDASSGASVGSTGATAATTSPDETDGEDGIEACDGYPSAVCGNGLVEALEECDSDCDGCIVDQAAWGWTVHGHLPTVRLVPDEHAFAVIVDVTEHRRYSADGEMQWAADLEDTYVYDVAVDAEGNHLVVGTQWNEAHAQVPWIGSWTADGTLRWSIQETASGAYSSIDVDASRIVVGGATEQVDSSRGRLLVAEYELDGSLRWAQKLTAFQTATDVVAIGDETVVLAAGLGADGMRTLLRYDADGERRWSVDAWGQGDAAYPPDELVPDGDGGTWIHGKLRERPVAARFDSDGREIDRLDCIGDASGWAMKLAVDSEGRVAIGVLVDSADPRSDAWVVLVEGGRSIAGYRLDPALEASLRFTALAWRSDDALVVAADEYSPDFAHILVLDAAVGF